MVASLSVLALVLGASLAGRLALMGTGAPPSQGLPSGKAAESPTIAPLSLGSRAGAETSLLPDAGIGRLSPIPAWATTVTAPAYGISGPLSLRLVRDFWQDGRISVGAGEPVPLYVWVAEDPDAPAGRCVLGMFLLGAAPTWALDRYDRVWSCPEPLRGLRITGIDLSLVSLQSLEGTGTLDLISGRWTFAHQRPVRLRPQ
jgi:hypothetical protein